MHFWDRKCESKQERKIKLLAQTYRIVGASTHRKWRCLTTMTTKKSTIDWISCDIVRTVGCHMIVKLPIPWIRSQNYVRHTANPAVLGLVATVRGKI